MVLLIMAEENNVKIDPITEEVEVPIDLTKYEHERLKEKLELFNKDIPEENKITFEEYLSLIFKTSILEDELIAKTKFIEILNSDVERLKKEIVERCSTGLESSEEVYSEIMELRRKTLENPSDYVKNYQYDYIKLMANVLNHHSRSFSYEVEDRFITFKEVLIEDIKENSSDVMKAIQIAKADLEPEEDYYKEMLESLVEFEKYVNLI